MENIEFLKYSLLLVIILIMLVLMFINLFIKIPKEKDSEFVVNHNVLLNVIDIYKELILTNKLNTLAAQYDLNEKSATNSRLAFEKSKNAIISDTAKEIIKQYLSKDCLRVLLKYYSIDGLSLLVITHLKR